MAATHGFKIYSDYYETGVSLYKKESFSLKEGLTVLCGCNGSGKTALLKQLKDRLEEEKIPVISFNNLSEGGDYSLSASLHTNRMNDVVSMMLSSEGENIMFNIGKTAQEIGNRVRKILQEKPDGKEIGSELFVFMDAADSGLSIDNVRELKDLFAMVEEDCRRYGIIPYIVISANEYELAKGEQCLAINTLSYTAFPDYESYSSYIMETRKEKDARYEREEQPKDYGEGR